MKMTQALVERYLKGECSAEEILFVESKLSNSTDIEHYLDQKDWDQTSVEANSTVDAETLEKIYARIQRRKKKKISSILKYTAAAASLVVIGFLYFKQQTHQKTISAPVVVISDPDSIKPQVAHLLHINSSNQNMELVCSDNSIITLYPNSEVRYLENFDGSAERMITLKGTAKFKVTKNKEKPFRVKSASFLTTALGTTFVVSERNQNTKIELLEGKIEVKSHAERKNSHISKEIASSGTLVINNSNARIINEIKPSTHRIDREAYFLENDEKLILKSMSLQDIISLLEQNYVIKISADSIKNSNKYFSGTFSNEPTAYKNIIKEINYLHKLNITYIQ